MNMKSKENTMIQAKKHDLADILYFLKENLADCIYMYIDIRKYSLFNDNMKVWINRENKNSAYEVL